mmetsp:Transcript_107047/g.302654  ORF Transcript_107047/g.302654 Transcript_107047/m.302654 type:complete len:119 (+) Transcript_107047:77-433(+)
MQTLSAALLAACLLAAARSDCLVGDIMYRDGDSVGYVGKTCREPAAAQRRADSFDGTETFCRGGRLESEPYVGRCSDVGPGFYCCQQEGVATCITGACVRRGGGAPAHGSLRGAPELV